MESDKVASRDPVCGMEVDVTKATQKLEYQDRQYYFCCPSCRQIFEMDPERFAQRYR